MAVGSGPNVFFFSSPHKVPVCMSSLFVLCETLSEPCACSCARAQQPQISRSAHNRCFLKKIKKKDKGSKREGDALFSAPLGFGRAGALGDGGVLVAL
jgi:hypothetical protein